MTIEKINIKTKFNRFLNTLGKEENAEQCLKDVDDTDVSAWYERHKDLLATNKHYQEAIQDYTKARSPIDKIWVPAQWAAKEKHNLTTVAFSFAAVIAMQPFKNSMNREKEHITTFYPNIAKLK